MPYYVSWIKDGRTRRFAYPHANLDTAIGFASEVLHRECSDVWISDENATSSPIRRPWPNMSRRQKMVKVFTKFPDCRIRLA